MCHIYQMMLFHAFLSFCSEKVSWESISGEYIGLDA